MFYKLDTTLIPCTMEESLKGDAPFVAALTPEEWECEKARFDFGIDLDMELTDSRFTKAVVNCDCLTGTFSIPRRGNVCGRRACFAFAMDEKGIVFIDGDDDAEKLLETLHATKKWRQPSLERFVYDLLESIIQEDLPMLEGYESTLTGIERRIMDGSTENVTGRVNELRGDLLTLRSHYEQLIDLGQELEENENGFFREEQLRLFHMFTDRVSRLQDNVASLRDYAVQVRELHQAQLDVRQNRTMAVLTVITTLFLPLTVITGWFGMNFEHMGILRESWGYPLIIALSVTIVAVCLLYFKRKKML